MSDEFKIHRGVIILNLLSANELEVECIYYKNFPHKDEICNLIKRQGEPTKVHSRFTQKKKKLLTTHRKEINHFFNKEISLYEKQFKVGMDKDATSNKKLFCHVR